MSNLIVWVIPKIDFIEHYPTEEFLHKGVWSLFGNLKSERPFIFRSVQGRDVIMVIVRSSIPLKNVPPVGTVKTVQEGLPKKDTMYKLSLRANPIVDKAINGKGKRIPLIKDEDIEAWAIRLLTNNGFSVITSNNGCPIIKNTPPVKKYMHDRGDFYISTSDINAIVKISDIDKAVHAFTIGIGKERSFGYGMISLLPLSIAEECLLDDSSDNENQEDND